MVVFVGAAFARRAAIGGPRGSCTKDGRFAVPGIVIYDANAVNVSAKNLKICNEEIDYEKANQ